MFARARFLLWRVLRKFLIWRHNPVSRLRIFLEVKALRRPIRGLFAYERHVYSQHGEDGILAAIFAAVGVVNKRFVEFGVGDGTECNSRLLAEQGWSGLWMDGAGGTAPNGRPIAREFITAENINDLFRKHGVAPEFDLLSLDLDGIDYWVWKALGSEWRPRVVVAEYNANFGPEESLTVPYDPAFRWDHESDYYGATLRALKELGESKGYVLVGCDSMGVNAFFVERSLAEGRFAPPPLEALWRPPIYGPLKNGCVRSGKKFQPV